MSWVRFIADFDWKPKRAVTVGYKAGMVLNVPAAASRAAIDAGKAVAMVKPSRDATPEEVPDETPGS